MRANKKLPLKSDKSQTSRGHKRGVVGYSRKTALLEEAITQMNAGKYGRSSAALKELLALDPQNMEARRLFATLHLRLGSLIPARQAFDSLISEAFQRQDYWLAESLLREYLAVGPRCVPFLEKLGALYQEKGDALEAVAEYGKAIDILIEDTDPDNPHHASQLYAKIRELAPASPVSFRLTSFFDAQTGELLARQSSDSGQSPVAPSLDMSGGSHGIQAGLEPMDGVMPREIQDSQATLSDEFRVADVSGSSGSLVPPVIIDLSEHHGPLDEKLVPSESLFREQTASSAGELQSDAPEGPRTHKFESTPSGVQVDDFSRQVGSESSHPSALSSVLAAESSEKQSGPDSAVLAGGPAAAQEQDRLLTEAEPQPYYDVSGSFTVSAPTESLNTSEPPISSSQLIEAASVIPSSQIEEISAPAFLGMEPSTAEPIEAEDRQPSLQHPLETNSKEMVAPSPDVRTPSNPESVSAHEISEPWKQPGFSWESVFNRAWKFGSDRSANVAPSGITKANVEESPSPAPAASPLQEQILENQAVEIPERETSTSLGDQTSSGSPIAPMPWDQVQELVISIIPTQTDQPIEENAESVVDRSTCEAVSVPNVGDDQAQPALSPIGSAAETETFSIAPDRQVSPEPQIATADFAQASVQTEGDFKFVEPEQPLPGMSSLTMDEPLALEAPMAAVASPIFESRPVTDHMVVVSPEVTPQSADSVLSADNDRETPAALSIAQKAPVIPSNPASEALSKEIEEIPIFQPLQKQQEIYELPPETAATPQPVEETTEVQTYERQPQAVALVEARPSIPELVTESVPEPAPEQEEWVKAEESIRFIEPPQSSPIARVPPSISERKEATRSMSVAAAAVDVLFESSRNVRVTETRDPVAESTPVRRSNSTLSRIRVAIVSFVSSCFSTTRAIVTTCVGLVMLLGVLIALGIGAIGLTWAIMEESPSPVFQGLTTIPQRTLSNFKKNGYFLLLGIDAPVGHDPMQAGYDRKLDTTSHDDLALACFRGFGTIEGSNASANVLRGWVRSPDPVGEFKSHQETIKGWGNQHQLALDRYSQWQKLPFEDWGYGQTVSPPCTAMVFAHQLYLADGFLQDVDLGVDRLETDMEAWRIVVGQARTLAVKMLALQAINDDIAVASGLLVRSDFDGKHLGRVTKVLRSLDQTELSLRWPMQSELVSASKTHETQLKAARAEEQPVYSMVASVLPLPVQRRLNDYADYYDASYKAAGEGQYGSLPKWKNYIHFPASGLMDYVTNPIENIVGLQPLAPWDLYNGFVVDTEAHLRLASLQAWLRRGPADGDLITRIAKAGQSLYDPYTGLPMLVNMKKGVLYSVGHDGEDQDADPSSDVVVEIPAIQMSAAQAKASAASSKSR